MLLVARARLDLAFGEEKPELGRVSAALYDFTLLHDLIVKVTNPSYDDQPISRNFWSRGASKLQSEDRARVLGISMESPLFLEIALGASLTGAAFWGYVQGIDRIRKWSLDHQLLEEQVQKARIDREIAEMDLYEALERRNAEPVFDNIARRLASDVEHADVRIEVSKAE